jgi:hypothetical protein
VNLLNWYLIHQHQNSQLSKFSTSQFLKMKDFPNEQLDRFIKITEATEILGYAHYRSVNMLIEKEILTSYKLPHVVRKRVLLSEVLKLKETGQVDQTDSDSINQNIKRGRGRPRKFG